jgi:hypothetical protein
MKDITKILPTKFKERAEFNPAGYWKLPGEVYITDNDSIVISIIDSAMDETLVIFWDEEHQKWFHYTNCFGLGVGDDIDTERVLREWLEAYP